MSDTQKVKVNGTEYDVELEADGSVWKATVNGQTFEIEVPDVEATAKPRRSGGRKKKKSGRFRPTFPARS
jgi:hypothetical protein